MTTEVQENNQENGANPFARVGNFAAKTIMVGFGVVGIAQDELKRAWEQGGSLLNRLEERGEELAQSGRDLLDQERDALNSQFESRQEQVKRFGSKADESIEKASGVVLTRANVPTAAEVQSLNKQISALSRKVDKLIKEQKELAAAQKEEQTEAPTEDSE